MSVVLMWCCGTHESIVHNYNVLKDEVGKTTLMEVVSNMNITLISLE